ncbi:hypothetical protein [Janibacter terrae]|uniref:hypothetical protein n=2 Tax=Janibacter terrae TaxID=103817 RepID=UPI000834CADB|nr:hypothetical protein [Janibacter terrae]MBA4085252.1 hypothetical protein [Kytococcus sp.]
MTTTTRTSTTPRLGTRMVAALGTAASVVALGAATAAPVSARPAGTSSAGSSASTTSDWCNRDLGAGSVSFSKRSWPLTGGLHMDTYNGTVSRSQGLVSGTTHLYNSYWGMGYTGSTMVVLRNSCGEVIGVTPPARWGVDAKTWFWNGNERYEYHGQPISSTITSRVASAEVIHNRVTGTDYKARYNTIRDLACQVFEPACILPRL